MRTKIAIWLICFLIIISSLGSLQNAGFEADGDEPVDNAMCRNSAQDTSGRQSRADYTSRLPIVIEGNKDFTPENGITPGSGLGGYPFLIENWIIDGNQKESCIYIANTTAYFIVRNCYLYNASINTANYTDGGYYEKLSNMDAGIKLYNVQNCYIEDNLCSNISGPAISLISSEKNYVRENTIIQNQIGIFLYKSNSNYIVNNNCSNNYNSIDLYESNDNIITGNNCTSNRWQVHSFDNSLLAVKLTTDKLSYKPDETVNISISATNLGTMPITIGVGSTQTGDFEVLDSSGKRVFLWSTGKAFPTLYVERSFPPGKTIELFQESWKGTVNEGTYTIKGYLGDLSGPSSNNVTILVSSTIDPYLIYPKLGGGNNFIQSDNNVISNNICTNIEGDCIYLERSAGNLMEYNDCLQNDGSGIFIVDSPNNILKNNKCEYNRDHGIVFHLIVSLTRTGTGAREYVEGWNTKLFSNKMVGSGIAFEVNTQMSMEAVLGNLDLSTNNTVNGKPVYYYKDADLNNISLTTNVGQIILYNVSNLRIEDLDVSSGSTGIFIEKSSHIKISNVESSNNKGNGIGISSSNYIYVLNSTLSNNRENGIDISIKKGSNYIVVRNCEIVSNNNNGIYADMISNSAFVYNSIAHNKNYGIGPFEQLCYYNHVHHNNFLYNNQGGVQGYDGLWVNLWNSSDNEGNYWSDYESRYKYASNDGRIWDTPYVIDGLENLKDNYPLVSPVTMPGKYYAPEAEIEYIRPGSLAEAGSEVSFKGIGKDRDGLIISYRWESDIDGLISTKSMFYTFSLSVGLHNISFSVQDNDGLWSEVRTHRVIVVEKREYKYHEPIIIDGNDNFTEENGVVTGSGTVDDPYIIEGWSIKGYLSGIEIRNTDAHFIIRHCYLNYSCLCELGSAGIQLMNVTNGIIVDNILYHNMWELWFHECSYISIKNNIMINTVDSSNCFVERSEKITFLNNTFFKKGAGLNLHYSDEIIIEHNRFIENEAVFRMFRSSVNIIRFNELIDCSFFSIVESENNTIHSNNFINLDEDKILEEDLAGNNNKWFDGYFRGNYWSNYGGVDNGAASRVKGDGVGDTWIPHLGIDNYPLIDPYCDENELKNIIITVFLTKPEFYVGEPITGTLTIYNNNPFDIELIEVRDPEVDLGYGVFFEIRSKSEFITYGARTEDIQIPIKVKAKGQHSINYSLEEFFLRLPGKSSIIPTGLYWMYSWLYYGNDTDHVIMYSNNVDLEIIEGPPEPENTTIILELDKIEFYVGEPIIGTITIINNNSYTIVLTDKPLERMLGNHFRIKSVDKYIEYWGLNIKELYPIEIKSNDITIIDFKIDKSVQLPEIFLSQINLTTGNYSIYAWFYYGNNTDLDFEYVYSNTVDFRVVENKTEPVSTDQPPGRTTTPVSGLSRKFFLGTVSAFTILIILISTIFITSTEVGKYGFFSAVAPLYSKTRKKRKTQENGYLRGLILGYIDGNPGESYNYIKRALDLNNGTLAYYLKILEREERVRSERDGLFKRFYPAQGRITTDVLELTDVQQDIQRAITENPGISQKDIQTQLGLSQQRVNYHIKLMADARLVKVERDGKKTKCFIIDDN